MLRSLMMAGAALAAVLPISSAHAAGTVYAAYTSTGQPNSVSVRDGTTLQQSQAYGNGLAANGIAADANGFYTSIGSALLRYDANGQFIRAASPPNDTTSFSAVTTGNGNGNLYAAYTGSQKGVTVRDAITLQQLSSFTTGVNATSIAYAPNGSLFVSAGNSLMEYSAASGSLFNRYDYQDPNLLYTGITYGNNVLAASYTSAGQQGISIRDLALNQLSSFNVGFAIDGIAAGNQNDVYLAAGNDMYHYSNAGALLGKQSYTADSAVRYHAVAFVPTGAVPEPATWAMMLAGFGLVGFALRRQPGEFRHA